MDEEIDWTFAEEHMWSSHMVVLPWAIEAVRDKRSVVFEPDPASHSGTSMRVLGFSPSAGRVLAVIIVRYEGRLLAASAWSANATQTRHYWKERSTDE